MKKLITLTITLCILLSMSTTAFAARGTRAPQDVKAVAKAVSYDELVNNPEKHTGEIIKLKAKVSQGGVQDPYYICEQDGDYWLINYELPNNETNIHEGDTVNFYGEFTGVCSIQRGIVGSLYVVPEIRVLQHDRAATISQIIVLCVAISVVAIVMLTIIITIISKCRAEKSKQKRKRKR